MYNRGGRRGRDESIVRRIVVPRRGDRICGDEGGLSRLCFAHEAGVDNYSIRLASSEGRAQEDLLDESRGQLLGLKDSHEGATPILNIGGALAIKVGQAAPYMRDVLFGAVGVPEQREEALAERLLPCSGTLTVLNSTFHMYGAPA